ncbi:hypothetical protein CVT25_004613 [Psilocybe cyanescens]|uniref:Uncharacterized protein n=1 Tax=Psilocybe cyanescens TaxID=93625 RepID=A0A409VSF5_PSICY|nr:hypothetical protein CVT25_004613 [Psilocybe cyanescens]
MDAPKRSSESSSEQPQPASEMTTLVALQSISVRVMTNLMNININPAVFEAEVLERNSSCCASAVSCASNAVRFVVDA